jgi:3-mercaptopyruvate sulfurtransferase SseA
MAEKKTPESPAAEKPVYKAEFLHNAGLCLWMYREPGVAEADVREPGFFAGARTRYGLKPGDIVLVNSAGKTFMVGV